MSDKTTHIALSSTGSGSFVGQQASGVFYYSQAWLDLITQCYGYTLYPLTVTNAQGRVTGCLPLCYLHSPITGRRLVGLPFSDHCPILAEDEDSARALLEQAIALARQKRVRYLELRTGSDAMMDGRSDFAKGNLYTHWLTPLTDDPQAIWSRLPSSVRGKVKKAQKLGVHLHPSPQRQNMLDYYRLHLRTRSKKHGMPAQPPAFFLKLWDAFAAEGSLQLLLAEHEGTFIAGTIMIAWNKSVRFLYAASDERYLHLAANNLLIWESIVWACNNGYQTLDQGRTARDNLGLMQFKSNWAAVEEALPYYYYPQMTGLAATSEHSWKYHALTSCWRRLPLQVSGPLGNYLYKHLG